MSTARVRTERPLVTLKYAQSLDGRVATATGESKWISGQETLRLAHELRAQHDAVLVGIGTVLADDPKLTVRLAEGQNPVRVVVDTKLRTPSSSALLHKPGRVIIATGVHPGRRRDELEGLGAEVVPLPTTDGRVDLDALLRALYTKGIRSILIEGGAAVITSFLRLRLVDRMVVVLAPRLLGAGKEAIAELVTASDDRGVAFVDSRFRQMGGDLVFTGVPVWPEAGHE